VRDVLELGCGGGHVASHLTDVDLTLVDVSETMLDEARRMVPAARHVLGDMRSVRLGRTFDGVLLHDAIDYMCTADDLAAALGSAATHLRSGGVLVVAPDHLQETFAPITDHGGSDGADGRAARYLEWTWDPDPSDTTITTEYAVLLRSAEGEVDVVHDRHLTGLFDTPTWLRLLAEAGFTDVTQVDDAGMGWRRVIFVAARG